MIKKKFPISIAIWCVFAAAPLPAPAGTTPFTTIDNIVVDSETKVVSIYPTGGVQQPPPCATDTSRYTLLVSPLYAQKMLTLLNRAWQQLIPVNFIGEGGCGVHVTTETLSSIGLEE